MTGVKYNEKGKSDEDMWGCERKSDYFGNSIGIVFLQELGRSVDERRIRIRKKFQLCDSLNHCIPDCRILPNN